MIKMKNVIKIGGLFFALLLMVATTQAQKFGYVNSSAILAEMPDVKQADANLEALQKQLQKKGQKMLEDLQKKYAEAQQKVAEGVWSPKQQEEEGAKLQAEQTKIAQFEQDMVNQIATKREELLKPILDRVNEAIKTVAKENGYQFIFDSQVLLYAEEAADVSSQVKSKLGI